MTGDGTALTRWFDAYVPRYAPERYAPLIRDAVRRAAPTTVGAARQAAGMLSGLVMWADETGMDVTPEVLFDQSVIDRYVTRAMVDLGYGPGSRVTAHWRLRVIAEAHDTAPTGARTRPVYRVPRPGALPYSPADVDGFVVWADAMRNPVNRHALLAMLGATLGAGLRAQEVAVLPGASITAGTPAGPVRVRIRGGTHPRTVTVLDRYADLLREAGCRAGPDWVVRPDRTGTDAVLATVVNKMIRDPRLPAFTLSRCRATWVCGHLTAGTRLDVLVAAGGFEDPNGLKGFMEGVPETAPDRSVAQLRAPRRGQPQPMLPLLDATDIR